jgi:hypothetical protein
LVAGSEEMQSSKKYNPGSTISFWTWKKIQEAYLVQGCGTQGKPAQESCTPLKLGLGKRICFRFGESIRHLGARTTHLGSGWYNFLVFFLRWIIV